MRLVLPFACCMFFLSGMSALVFEELWFRQTSLIFGSSVWASALVLSSFMGGLAIGNGIVAQLGHRLRRPLIFYALLEIAIACGGLLLVIGLPGFAQLFSPLFRHVLDAPLLLHTLRSVLAFGLLVLPAIAMGATLPTLVHAMRDRDSDFGRVLGLLYGWNTLGAVVGAVSGEWVWIPALGILGSGLLAAALNLLAALLAYLLALRLRGSARSPASAPEAAPLESTPGAGKVDGAALRLLAASFLSGAVLLGLEVVWFRILAQFLPNASEIFALMLAVVLAGIALGSLAAARWLRESPDAHARVALVILFLGIATVGCYTATAVALPSFVATLPQRFIYPKMLTLSLSALLMFVPSALSGLAFTLLGKRLHEILGSSVRSSGLLTLANTLGSMLGPLLAGFVLLPTLGSELSVWLLAATYPVVAGLAWGRELREGLPTRLVAAGAGLIMFASLAFFPFGRVEAALFSLIRIQVGDRSPVVALREGVVETAAYLRRSFLGEPLYYRLVTDGYSMATNSLRGRRYMTLFAHLPAAVHPGMKDALLISFGVGSTARTLVSLEELESIHVVDISRETLELSDIAYPEPGQNPLDDPRVEVHIEDGRFFLQTTPKRFDLITGEPPPPAQAGIVNLYTREYFSHMRSRLREGGLVTYWLPVNQMTGTQAKAIVRSFCEVFPDCSAWEGRPIDWILMGSREAVGPVSLERFISQWEDERIASALESIGVDLPAQLGSLFLADAQMLREWVGDTPPLIDDRPARAPHFDSDWWGIPPEFEWFFDGENLRDRFERSDAVATLWPPSMREQALLFFELEAGFRAWRTGRLPFPRVLALLRELLAHPRPPTIALWMLGSDHDRQSIVERAVARGEESPLIDYHLALRAIWQRDFLGGAELLDGVPARRSAPNRDQLALFALAMGGDMDGARDLARRLALDRSPTLDDQAFWDFMEFEFGIDRISERAAARESRDE